MDYKTIINQLNTFKSEFIDYFNERKLKNDKDVANIIDTYLVSLENKNVSLQAFKTRIIHNGHSVEKLIPIITNRVISLAVDLGGREDYEKISNSQTVSKKKQIYSFGVKLKGRNAKKRIIVLTLSIVTINKNKKTMRKNFKKA